MALLDTLARLLLPETPAQPLETRTTPWQEFPTLEEQLARLHGSSRPWRVASIQEALGVPAIFRAVTLISNTVGSLALEAFRDGARMPQADAPRLLVRPNPLTTPREFFRDVSYCLATRGEAWLWIAKRDVDGVPIAVYPVPPQEIQVHANDKNRLRPTISWGTREMSNADMVQMVLTREPGSLRGAGPLQVCGAAVSVIVESQEFAANFYALGGVPSIVIKSAVGLDDDEAATLKAQWLEQPNNVPRVIDPTIESVEPMGADPEKAQFAELRQIQTADAARMFGIPGALLEYQAPGSSLTYQNVTEIYTQFARTCLVPNYLEPIEQAMSDLLTRSTVGRFNLDSLLRADVKTRYDVHTAAIDAGVYDADYARQVEGIEPGNVETAPIPAAVPASTITSLPVARSAAGFRSALEDLRCSNCRRLVGRVSGAAEIRCPKCGATVVRAA